MELFLLTMKYFLVECMMRIIISLGISVIIALIVFACYDFYSDYQRAKQGLPNNKPIDIYM